MVVQRQVVVGKQQCGKKSHEVGVGDDGWWKAVVGGGGQHCSGGMGGVGNEGQQQA